MSEDDKLLVRTSCNSFVFFTTGMTALVVRTASVLHCQHRSRSVLQVQMEVWHVGSFRFKGVPEPVHVMHLGNTLVSGRVFSSHTPSKKAERVAPALGLQCIVAVPAI